MQYKYTTTFEAEVSACAIGDSLISMASLNNLQSLLPDHIDFDENIDLLPVAFNAAVVNKFNKNGDGIDSVTAAKFTKNFLHKPTNIEHDKEKIVGHIASAGFSEYGTNKILSESEVKNLQQPFNIALGAVVYKSANKAFAEALERSVDPEDPFYHKISTSWEIGFTDYTLAVGSEDLSTARIVTNPDEIEELKGYLKAYGGNGRTKDGENIYRLITGNIYPLGIGFTSNPAADVKGVYMKEKTTPIVTINDKRDKKISQSNKNIVNFKKNNSMEIEKLVSELKDLLVEKKFSEEAVASMTSTFTDAIKQKDEEYRKDIAKAQEEKDLLIQQSEELKASVEELKAKFAESQEKIAEFEASQKAEQAIARFNERMDVLDQKFDLEDEDKQFLAQELKSLDLTEEAFASFEDKLNVLWRHKNKESKAKFQEEVEAKIAQEVEKRLAKVSTASEKTTTEILDNVESKEASIANSNETVSRQEPSLREKFASAFNRENIVIS